MLSAILQMIVGAILSLKSFIMVVFRAGVWPDWQIIGYAFIIYAFWLGSGFLAATIAEMRGHKVLLHFFLGLLAPYIYPGYLAFKLRTAKAKETSIDEMLDVGESANLTSSLLNIKVKQNQERAQRQRLKLPTKEELEAKAVESINPIKDDLEAQPVETDGRVYDKRFFENLAVESSGERAGPFEVFVNNGTRLEILNIKSIQDDLAVFEIQAGKKIKSIRIKYQNIISFNKINQRDDKCLNL
ncbi:MAG: hypothetical protein GY750_01610 [Lentisphaerae bacterium]|nr:hypothetical protein [Lentisphaerota bacterium]MCP4100117.1 hypothetical protein [Lentisphaerota bacterium]